MRGVLALALALALALKVAKRGGGAEGRRGAVRQTSVEWVRRVERRSGLE